MGLRFILCGKILGFGLYNSIWEPISIDFGEATDRQEQVLAQAFFPYQKVHKKGKIFMIR